MDRPVFSIIVPTFNSAATMEVCIKSIMDQTFPAFEVLIMDGGSSDNTVAIAGGFADERIKIVSENDKGIYDAMNKGILRSAGNWLYFLGSDDSLYDKETLRKVAAVIEEGNADVVYGNVFRTGQQCVYDGEFTIEKIYRRNICHQAIFLHRTVFDKTGLFDLNYKSNADYDHNLKWFFDDSVRKRYMDVIVANYSDTGLSGTFIDWKFRDQKPEQFLRLAGNRIEPRFRAQVMKDILRIKFRRRQLGAFFYYSYSLARLSWKIPFAQEKPGR